MRKKVHKGVAMIYLVLLSAILFVAYVRHLEKTSVFYPAKLMHATPKEVDLDYEDVYLRTEDGLLLHGWFIKSPNASTTFLYFHGNAGNISDRLDKIALFHGMGLNVFIVDYRGYGLSDGSPSEKGIYKDGRAAFDYLLTRKDVDAKKIVGYGASLGGTVVLNLANSRPLSAVIIDAAFSNAQDMAKRIYPWIPSFFVSIKLDNLAYVKSITVPKLFMHSKDDHTVPFALGQKLLQAAPEPKEFLETRGNHNDGYLASQDIYLEGIRNFLKKNKLL